MRLFGCPRPVKLRHHARLAAPSSGLRLVSASVGPADVASCIWTAPEDLHGLGMSGDELGALPWGESTNLEAVLTTFSPSLESLTRVSGVLPAYPTLQPMPDGGFVWIGARAAWRREDPERNALVFDSDGTLMLAECVGDGVGPAQTSRTGEVWLGFSDEGVYGNLGWGSPGPAPLGHSGIVRRSPGLVPLWEFPSDGVAVVDDCHALNVTDSAAWAYYYSDYPIVRITLDGAVTSWRTDVDGAQAILTDADHAALVGGYGKERDRVVVGRLEDEFTPLMKTRVVMPDGRSLPDQAVMHGRGDQLHVFVGDIWLRAGLTDLMARA